MMFNGDECVDSENEKSAYEGVHQQQSPVLIDIATVIGMHGHHNVAKEPMNDNHHQHHLFADSATTVPPSQSQCHLTDDIQDITARQVPNTKLTSEQRQAKQELKRQLKRKMRMKTLENRIKQAMKVNNQVIIQEARWELQELWKQEDSVHTNNSIHATPPSPYLSDSSSTEVLHSVAHDFLIDLCRKLQENHSPHRVGGGDSSERRKLQNDQSAILLKHMTKGTQQLDMFHNEHALHGYTRQKFLERGMVLVTALYRLLPLSSSSSSLRRQDDFRHDDPTVNSESQDEAMRKQHFWDLVGQVKSVCSIGCGPGCDAMGVVAFLMQCQHDSHKKATTTSSSSSREDDDSRPNVRLERVILLDWAMEQWKLILEPLQEMVVPHYINTLDMAFCDIRERLQPPMDLSNYENGTETATSKWMNQKAFQLLMTEKPTHHAADSPSSADERHSQFSSTTATKTSISDYEQSQRKEKLLLYSVDLFVFSYLLSENRDKWDAFCQDLIHLARPNSLFFFSDPTAWQLHRLLLLFPSNPVCSSKQDTSSRPSDHVNVVAVDWIWLDSSMDNPALQCLEGRVGPAVLLGRKL